MSLEGKPEQFNKEKFMHEFGLALNSYAKAIVIIHNNPYLNDMNPEIKKNFESDEKQGMEQMISVSVRALKLSENKKETLDIINKIVRDLNLKSSEHNEIVPEADLLKNVILELLKV